MVFTENYGVKGQARGGIGVFRDQSTFFLSGALL